MKRLWQLSSLNQRKKALNSGVEAAGAQIPRKTAKVRQLLAMANIVNVNSAVLPAELYELTLNCRYILARPVQGSRQGKEIRQLDTDLRVTASHCRVEIDRDTFIPRILDYVAVDDCGKSSILRSSRVKCTAQQPHGIGAALMENCVYDAVAICSRRRSATTLRSLP